ncbi:hypothetical protein ACTHPF_21640 [Paenibacillus sp. SAF-054]|uniref:hypothetical protein n=1 Tax=unclassified Paenibacillus TaxID=185978 RepID=UPI003F7FC592
MYPDQEIRMKVHGYFRIEDFHTRDMGEGVPHFQSILLRKEDEKAQQRGKFQKRILLIEAED